VLIRFAWRITCVRRVIRSAERQSPYEHLELEPAGR
jgi:hypothetical protein